MRFIYLVLALFMGTLMFACGSTDESSVAAVEAERGMNSAESESFLTTLETLDQAGEVKSEFGTEIVKIRLRVMNKSEDAQLLRFRTGKKADVFIYSGGDLIWSTQQLSSIQMIDEKTIEPKDQMEVVLDWDLLDLKNRLVSPGTYRVQTKLLAEENVPAPGDVIFDIKK